MEIPQELKDLSKRDLIRLLLSEREEFREALYNFRKEVEELKRKLLAYENAHTPPSQRGKYPKREYSDNPVGAPQGHEGTTRPIPKPNKFETLEIKECPNCGKGLGGPIYIKKKIIEDIPEQQPLVITQFTVPHYFCNHCNAEVIPSHPDLPSEGRFGPNLQAQITLMKYEDRLPYRKIAKTLNRQYGLQLTPATVLDIIKRVSDKLQWIYEEIKKEIKNSMQVNADETGQKVQGKQYWNWVFVTITSILFVIRKSRGQKVVMEVLGKDYKGITGCDGWKPYPSCVKIIQRCWAHLLRESKWYMEQCGNEAKFLYDALCKMFNRIKRITVETPEKIRKETYDLCIKEMSMWIKRCKAYRELRKFSEKIENGLEHWFTCILHPEIEPTNNKAERALRESVIQRKISSLWNEKGVRIKETIMSVLATWNLRGLNSYSMLRQTLSS